MRISDWSSDVCSSDLSRRAGTRAASRNGGGAAWSIPWPRGIDRLPDSPCAWGARQGATPCPFPQERLQPRALRPLSTIKIPRLAPLLQRLSLPRDREDGKSVVWGQCESVRVDLGGRRICKKKKQQQ